MALLHCPFAGSCHVHPDGTVTGPPFARPSPTMAPTRPCLSPHMPWTPRAPRSPPATRPSPVCAPSPSTARWPSVSTASWPPLPQVVAGSDVQVSAPTSSTYWRFQAGATTGVGPLLHNARCGPDRLLPVRNRHRARCAALGGSSSYLGTPTSLEYDVSGGRARNYTGGRLFGVRHGRPRRSWKHPREVSGGRRPGSVRIPHPRRSRHFQRASLLFHQGPHLLVVHHRRTRRALTHTHQVPRCRGGPAGTASR